MTPASRKPLRGIGGLTCFCIVVANMVGTGVFTSLGFQLQAVQQPFLILLLWVLGGIFALCGALCYAEVATSFPRSGGEYTFLGNLYHPSLGFMAGVISLIAGFAAPVALAALAFGKYLAAAVPGIPPLPAAIVLVLCVTGVHMIHLSASSGFQIVFSVLKILLVVGLAAAGFFLPVPQELSWFPDSSTPAELLQPAFATSLLFAMYAYSGWNAACYLTGEIRDVQRTLRGALLWGTLTVMVLYLLLNTSFLLAAPAESLKGQLEIGNIVGGYLFGESGARVVSFLICLGLISAVSAMTWAGPRVGMVMGEDHHLFRLLAKKNRGGIPWVAVLFQLLIVLLLLASGSFEAVLIYAQVALLVCSALVVAGVFVLRRRGPRADQPAPARVWLFPLPPILFLLISAYAVLYNLWENPLHTAAGFFTMLLAVLLYFCLRERNK